MAILELTCRGGASRAQHNIVEWLRYKEDFQQGSGGATPRSCRIFVILRLENGLKLMLKNMENAKITMPIYTATFPQQFSKKRGPWPPLRIAYAFDTVPHQRLLKIITYYSICSNILQWWLT